MTCDEFTARLTPYTSGTLSASECDAMESHAAECVGCETLMERATAAQLPTFTPPVPAALRAPVLRAIDERRRRAQAKRWTTALALLGAAALLAVILRPTTRQGNLVVADSSTVAASAQPRDARSPADERAQSEFIALDDAARELQSALVQAPNDRQLTEFLRSVTERRQALQRQVKDARS